MIRPVLSVLCLLASVLTLTANPPAGRTLIMSDGTKAYPSNSVATPAQVSSVADQLDPLSSQAATARSLAEGAAGLSVAAYDSVRFMDASNIVSSTAYIQSVGAQASAGTNQVIRIHSLLLMGSPTTNLHLIATFDKLQTVAPTVDFRQRFTQGGTNTVWASTTNTVCSWPATVTDNTVTNSAYIYSFDVPVPALESCFFRVLSRDDGGSGSGFYFLVYNYISVNGRIGRTGDVEGVGHYEGGILAAPLEGQ